MSSYPDEKILSYPERVELDQLEARIEAGRKGFVEVGAALSRIKTGRLYRETHATFEGYLIDRWAIHHSHGYQLINAATVVGSLSAIADRLPTNEAQARPLVGLEPEQAQEAWTDACDEAEGQPTAAQVQEAVDRLRAAMPGIEPTRAEVEREERRVRDDAARDGRRDLLHTLGRAVQKLERLHGQLDAGEQEQAEENLRPYKVWLASL